MMMGSSTRRNTGRPNTPGLEGIPFTGSIILQRNILLHLGSIDPDSTLCPKGLSFLNSFFFITLTDGFFLIDEV